MLLKEKTLYNECIKELEDLWDSEFDVVTEQRIKHIGIRSSQIATVILYLIKKGVLK